MAMFLIGGTAQVNAQSFLNKLKDKAVNKVKDKIENKVEREVDKAADEVLDGKKSSKSSKSSKSKVEDEDDDNDNASVAQTKKKGATTESQKSDFERGAQVFFTDDFDGEQLGEFPSKWDLINGTVEVGKINGTKAFFVESNGSRAEAVVKALEGLGVDGFNLRAVGKGSHEPVADNKTEEGRAKNRRVEFIKK